jgi:fatty acid desaturase
MQGTVTRVERPVHRRTPRPPSDYSRLLLAVQAAGLFRRRRVYYTVKIILLATVLAGVWAAFVILGNSWMQIAVAAALALTLTQIMFLSHDAAHRQMFKSHKANELAALVLGTLVGGVSLIWWNNKHNRHHAAPNQIGKDPDITSSLVHFFPAANPPRSRVGALLHHRQGWWFYPLLLVEALNLHAQSFHALVSRPALKHRWTELMMMTVRCAGYPVVLFVVLSPGIAAAFLGVQLGLTGLYLGSTFAASHIGMPVMPADSRIDFLRRQVLMSRNVAGGRAASFAMGGLNYQIEHHLFPNLPRPTLRQVRPIVRQFCHDSAITYQEVTIFRAWALVAGYLNEVGLAGRDPYQCPVVSALRPR